MHHPFIPCFNRYMVECEWNIYLASSRLRWVLIDTWWNVNYYRHLLVSKMVERFNRYMVECEYASFAFSNASFARFNRYMVECEYFYFTCRYCFTTVLIDTWWNVNVTEAGLCNAMNFVLIDTWWNVNYDVYEIEELATGFNRYMVECEFKMCVHLR